MIAGMSPGSEYCNRSATSHHASPAARTARRCLWSKCDGACRCTQPPEGQHSGQSEVNARTHLVLHDKHLGPACPGAAFPGRAIRSSDPQ